MSKKPSKVPRQWASNLAALDNACRIKKIASYPAAGTALLETGVTVTAAQVLAVVSITSGTGNNEIVTLVANTDYEIASGVLKAKGSTYVGETVLVIYNMYA